MHTCIGLFLSHILNSFCLTESYNYDMILLEGRDSLDLNSGGIHDSKNSGVARFAKQARVRLLGGRFACRNRRRLQLDAR